MNRLLKILTYDPLDMGDDEIEDCDTGWHLVGLGGGSDPSILCSGLVFGFGVSGIQYEEKQVKRGGITCERCLRLIKAYKAVKL